MSVAVILTENNSRQSKYLTYLHIYRSIYFSLKTLKEYHVRRSAPFIWYINNSHLPLFWII